MPCFLIPRMMLWKKSPSSERPVASFAAQFANSTLNTDPLSSSAAHANSTASTTVKTEQVPRAPCCRCSSPHFLSFGRRSTKLGNATAALSAPSAAFAILGAVHSEQKATKDSVRTDSDRDNLDIFAVPGSRRNGRLGGHRRPVLPQSADVAADRLRVRGSY